jgi:hypothetical protein
MLINIKMRFNNIKFGMSYKEGRLVQCWGSTLGLGYVQIWTQQECCLILSGHNLSPTKHLGHYMDGIMKASFRILPNS